MPNNRYSSDSRRSVLFVCSANQCRSPMAMVLFSDLLQKQGQNPDEWYVESAGCWAYSGFPATSNAVASMRAIGLDLESHRSQPVTESLLNQFKLILCMEHDHKKTIQRNFPENASKVFLLSEMIGNGHEVDDPVGLSLGIYASTADKISSYLVNGFNRILELTM